MQRILDKAARVNESELESLYRRVFAYLLRLSGGNRSEAEEVAQETFVRILRSQFELREADRLVPWALRIATNVRLDLLRRRPTSRLEGDVEATRTESSDETPLAIRQVAELPEPYKTVLSLRYFEDLDYDEIAQILDVPVGTLKSQVCRGLKMIRKKMEKP